MVMVCMCVPTNDDGVYVCGDSVWNMVFVMAITLHIFPNKVTGVSAIV